MEPGKFPSVLWEHLFASSPGETLESYYHALTDPKIHAQSLSRILDRNPAFAHLIHSSDLLQARRKKWQEEVPAPKAGEPPLRLRPLPNEQLIAALGKFQIRDALAALRMQRVSLPGVLPRKAKDKFSLSTKTPLKFALQTESYCEDHRMANPEKGFAAGLHYDWLLYRLTQQKGSPKDLQVYAEDLWKEGLKIARIAYALGSHSRVLTLSPFAFSAGLLLPLGKGWMAWLFKESSQGSPSWKEFQGECEKLKGLPVQAEDLLEPRRFPITHRELSSLFVANLGLLKEAVQAIAASNEPVFLKGIAPDAYELAKILKASRVLAEAGGVAKLSSSHREFVLSIGISESELKDVLSHLQEGAK